MKRWLLVGAALAALCCGSALAQFTPTMGTPGSGSVVGGGRAVPIVPFMATAAFAGNSKTFADPTGTVMHCLAENYSGGTLTCATGGAWTTNGTPTTDTSTPLYTSFSGSARKALASLSDSNYFQLGTGSDVMDVTTPLYCFTYKVNSRLANNVLVGDGQTSVGGWLAEAGLSDSSNQVVGAVRTAATAGSVSTNGEVDWNVACTGRNLGGRLSVMVNAAPQVDTDPASTTAITAATTIPATIGKYYAGGLPATNVELGEFWFSTRGTDPISLLTQSLRTWASVTDTNQPLVMGNRNSASTETAPDGTVVHVPNYAARVESAGLLVEPQTSQLLSYTESISNAAWSKGNVGTSNPVVTADQATAPDGTTTADKVDFPAVSGAGNASIVYQQPSTWATGQITGSVYAKAVSGTPAFYVFWLDSTTGTYSTPTLCQPSTSAWTRCSNTFSITAGNNVNFIFGTYLGTGSSQSATLSGSVYLWGAQVKQSPFVLSYQPNDTATKPVTYGYDKVGIHPLDVINGQAGEIDLTITPEWTTANITSERRVLTCNSDLTIKVNSDSTVTATINGVSVASAAQTWVRGTGVPLVFRYAAGGRPTLSVGGVTTTAGSNMTAFAPSGADNCYLGSEGAGSIVLAGWLSGVYFRQTNRTALRGVLCHGDSLMAGHNATTDMCTEAVSSLNTARPSGNYAAFNRGTSGWRSDQIAADYAKTVGAPARFRIIDGWINDAAQDRTELDAWASVKAQIDSSLADNVPVIVVLGPPWVNSASYTSDRAAVADAVDADVVAYAAANPTMVWTVDPKTVVGGQGGDAHTLKTADDSGDHIHWNNTGQIAMGAAISTVAQAHNL